MIRIAIYVTKTNDRYNVSAGFLLWELCLWDGSNLKPFRKNNSDILIFTILFDSCHL